MSFFFPCVEADLAVFQPFGAELRLKLRLLGCCDPSQPGGSDLASEAPSETGRKIYYLRPRTAELRNRAAAHIEARLGSDVSASWRKSSRQSRRRQEVGRKAALAAAAPLALEARSEREEAAQFHPICLPANAFTAGQRASVELKRTV